MKGKRWIALIVCAMLVFVFASCTGGPASSSTPVSSGTGQASASQGSYNGEMVAAMHDEALKNNYGFIVDEMQKEHPNLKINLEITPVANLDQKVNMAHASGQDYDFIAVNNSSVQQLHAAGVLEPLDGYLEKAGINLSDYYSESLLDVGRIDGVLYAIPQSPDCRVLAYNKKALDEAGIPAPKTQEDILKIAEQLAKDGVYAYARQMNSLSPLYNEGCFMLADGAEICKEVDGKIVPACNTPEMIGQVEFWQKMTPYMPKDLNYSDDQVRSMFAQGKILFYIFGPWEIGNIIDQEAEYGVDYELMPVPGKVKNGSVSGGFYMGIGAGSKNKDAAWEFIEKSLVPENICELKVNLPADQRCYEMAPYNTPIYQPFLEAYETATPPMPYSPNFNKIADIFYEYFNRALIGGEDAAEMMALCEAELEKLLLEQ